MTSRWGAGRRRDQEFGFGHDGVLHGLPSGSVEKLSEYMSLNSGVRSSLERSINLGGQEKKTKC